jgi:dTDP-4-amino-4,6-dideoxygalactose transaminase
MSKSFIPFHRPYISDDEINEVTEAIRSGWWTTGPKTLKFENDFRTYIGTQNALAVSSWTAAAHLALEAIGLKSGDEVIVPAMTFTACAEIVCYFNAKPVIVDIQRDSYNIDPDKVEKAITKKTKAIIPVHYGGQPCDMDEIIDIAKRHKLYIIEDAAHALPSYYKGKIVGTLSDVTCFSFYATKTLATGEGGMICTNNEDIAKRCSIMRLHGINSDAWKRYTEEGSWYYEVVAPGYKYNFTDIQAGLGLAQLRKIDEMHVKRKEIFEMYNEGFKNNEQINFYKIKEDRISSYHLYPIELNINRLTISRSRFIEELKENGIGASVHFIPLYRHPYYRQTFNLNIEDYPVTENVYPEIITLPIWPGMKISQIEQVIDNVNSLMKKFTK